jgi:nucleoid-associated protein YgaU
MSTSIRQEDKLRAVVAAYVDLASAAAQDLAEASTRAQQAACRELQALALQNAKLYSLQAQGGTAPAVVVSERGDTVFTLAQRELGDARRYRDILRANGRAGLALDAGTLLYLPPP